MKPTNKKMGATWFQTISHVMMGDQEGPVAPSLPVDATNNRAVKLEHRVWSLLCRKLGETWFWTASCAVMEDPETQLHWRSR